MKLPTPLRPLENRDYRVYWTGQLVSLVGTWMQQMAMGWVITRLTSRALVVGALTLVGALPMALLAFKGGQLADRLNRRNILIATQAVMGLLALSIAALAYTGRLSLAWIFVFSALLGVAAAFDLPAAQAFAPELVAPEDIPRAVALMQAIFHGSRLIGPAVAGLAIERWGEASAFLANGLSFLAVIASLLAIPAVRPARDGGGPRRGGGGMGEGLAYVKSDPVIKRLILLLFACMTFAFPFVVSLMAYYARYVVHATAADMGRIMSTSGLGAVIGSSILVLVGARAWRQRIGVGVVLVTTGVIGLAFARTTLVATVFVSAFSVGTSFYLGTITQVVQQRVPNHVRGRVMALFMMGMTSLMPISSLVLAALVDVVGFERLLLGCGAIFGVVTASLALTLPPDVPETAPAA
ncbi:transporter, putative [Minicystis rosea]|nr:transporter, putative [Minicystis rosea]